jgi:hypothetical protein
VKGISTGVSIPADLDYKAMYREHLLEKFRINFGDFEDAVQYFATLPGDCGVIISRDKKDFKDAQIPVSTPKEYFIRCQNNSNTPLANLFS